MFQNADMRNPLSVIFFLGSKGFNNRISKAQLKQVLRALEQEVDDEDLDVFFRLNSEDDSLDYEDFMAMFATDSWDCESTNFHQRMR